MNEVRGQSSVPIKMYQTQDRLTIAAPMPGLQPSDIVVSVTSDGKLTLRGELRGELRDVKDVLVNEWSIGDYYRDLTLPVAVDGERANLTYDNGVLVVALPVTQTLRPAELTLETIGRARGQRVG